MGRGVRRQLIFQDDFDNIIFKEIMHSELVKNNCTLHAYCLMSNHFHLLLETGDIHVGKFMKSLSSKYAMQYNHRYSYKGHVFEDRYKSCIVETDEYFLQTSRYIHLNPVKAGMVEHPEDYAWSSYRGVLGMVDDRINEGGRTLGYFKHKGIWGYREFVEDVWRKYTVHENEIKKCMGEDDLWLPW
jgi:REP element-mobilizing transposase RayT